MNRITLLIYPFFLMAFNLQAHHPTNWPNGTSTDQKFLRNAVQKDLLIARTGQLAEEKSSNYAVRNTAKTLEDESTQANADLHELCSRKNISVPETLSIKKEDLIKKLSGLNDMRFDKKVSIVMIHANKKLLKLCKKESKDGKDAELKSWASARIPKLEQDLKLSKEACKMARK